MKKNLFLQTSRVLLATAMAMQVINAKATSTPPTISTQPVGAAEATGTAYTFHVQATSSNLLYQWFQGSSPVSAATSSNLVFSALAKSNAGSYTVVVTNDGGSVTSQVAVLVVQDPPAITNFTGTATNIIAVGHGVSMTVQASGDGLGFVWMKGTTALTGATSSTANDSTYTISSVASGDAGTYTCKITNATTSTVTATFQLIAVSAPAITTQPAGKGMALGSNYTMSVTATGTYLHYFWSQNATNAVVGDTNKLTITDAAYGNAGSYSVIVSNLTGMVTSSTAVITVQALPVITNESILTNIVATNISLTLSVGASGDNLSYQWHKGTAAVSGATTNALTFANLAATDAGTYSVTISNLASTVTSSNFLVVPVADPTITVQPAGKGMALGSNYTMSVTASGSYLHYFWKQNGSTAVGSDTNKLAITGAQYANAGTYSVIVSNLTGTVTSSNAIITVQAPAAITNQSTLTNIVATNHSLTLSVGASGDNLSYQWHKGTTAVSGATTNALTFANLYASNAGTYSVTVSNLANSVTSTNFLVIPVPSPAITAQPLGKGMALGSNYTMSVTASGTYLHYFWSQNATNAVGSDTNKLTITGAAYTDAGSYSVLVSNLTATVASSNAVITVQAPPVITNQSILTNIVATNHSLTLSVGASGDNLSYHWHKGTTAVSGATTNALTFANLYASNAGTYSVTVSNLAGSVTSTNFVVIPVPSPAITLQPLGKGLALGSNYTMSVTATGTYLHYFWSQNATNAVGGDTNKLTFTAASYTNAGTYSVIVSNLTGMVTSSNATLIVESLPAIAYQTPGSTNATNQDINLWVAATGDNLAFSVAKDGKVVTNEFTFNAWTAVPPGWSPSEGLPAFWHPGDSTNDISWVPLNDYLWEMDLFDWYDGTPSSRGWYPGDTNFSVVYLSLLQITNCKVADAGKYQFTITNSVASIKSSNAPVVIVLPPTITTQPKGGGVALGSNYVLSVTAGSTYLHYFWSQNVTNTVGGDTNKLTITGAGYTNSGVYSVVVSNLAGTITSSNATLIVEEPLAIVTQPVGSTNQRGGTITLSVTATGDGLRYLWSKNGKTVTNSTVVITNTSSYQDTLTIANAAVSDGGSYQVVVSNAVAALKSTNAAVVVIAPPTLAVAASTVSVLQSASGTLKVTATGTGPIGFQWNFNGTNDITGATNATYTITNMVSGDAGSYQLTATNFGGSTVTNILVKYVADTNPPVVTLTGAGATFSNATLTVAGKATDNVATTNVVYSLDLGATFSNAVTTNGWTNFGITNILTKVGTNTLIVKAVDINNNWSAPLTNHPVYAPLYTVALSISGTGTVSSNWSAKVQWGKSYSASAKPGVNMVLVGWSGDITTNAAAIKFSPTNNMTLTATFTTNLFIGCGGSYNGLFTGTNGGTNLAQSGGYLTMAVTTNQTYTGKIYAQGVSASLNGSFNADGTLNATNVGTNGLALTLHLSLDFANKELVGTISNANWASTNLQADLAVFSAKNPTTNAGTYTLVIPTESDQGLGEGYASGTVVVATNGAITFIGVTADNASLSQSTTLSDDGYWPLYVGLYPASTGAKADQGLLMGWVQFTNGLPTNSVDWVSPVSGGLADSSSFIESSVFTKPAKGVNRVLTNKLATITFNGAGLTSSFSEIMIIADDGTVATDGQATIKISTSGIITGDMVDPTTQKSSKIYGIVLQKDPTCLGKGSIAGPSSIGNFVITAYPPAD